MVDSGQQSRIRPLVVMFVGCTVVTDVASIAREPTESPARAAIVAADEARIEAFRNPTQDALDAILSSDLHYAHSTGVVDTKPSFMDALMTGTTRYVAFDYETRDITAPAPGIALMTGSVRIRAETRDTAIDAKVSFLAVWRLEEGEWRFLAWQSCRIPPSQTR
ncbi:MAG: nuclear transport factor 2 family protein [Planctomycetaceae bacterium]